MIVDDLSRAYPGFKKIADTCTVIQVPFRVAPYDDADGIPGILWTEDRIPKGLEPRTPIAGQPSVDARWANPPYGATILIGDDPRDPTCVMVFAQPCDPEVTRTGWSRDFGIDAAMEHEEALGADTSRLRVFKEQLSLIGAPRYHMTAVTVIRVGDVLVGHLAKWWMADVPLAAPLVNLGVMTAAMASEHISGHVCRMMLRELLAIAGE